MVVLDFAMPGTDGNQLARAIRARRADLPLVLLSSKSGDSHDPTLFDARLLKPVLRTLLRETLRSVITRTRGAVGDAQSAGAAEAIGREVGLRPLAALRVLVAEDNPINAIVIGAMLERLGVSSDRVFNGAAAVLAVER